MAYPVGSYPWREPGPSGYTYGAVLVRLDARAEVLGALRDIRFSGWVCGPVDGWLVAVARHGDGTVASGRSGVIGVGERLAARFATTVLAVRVVDDRQLTLVGWDDGDEIGRYVSDPAHGLPADDAVLPEPVGAEHGPAFAVACGRPEAADDLTEALAEELDPESVIESERLATILRLLGLPHWLVSTASLPGDLPTGPRAREFTRLGAGRPGLLGRAWGRAAHVVRRRRPPPPVLADPPRGRRDIDPWLM